MQQGLSDYNPPFLWRLLTTAVSFTLFGVGGFLLRVIIFPLLALLPGDALAHRRRARATVSRVFLLFARFMYHSGTFTYEVQGIERLGRPGQLVIANHPSLIDVVMLIAFIRDSNCVVKQSLWDNPCMRGPIRAAGYISNDGSLDMLDKAAGALQDGETLVVFPEGTRTTPGQNPEFHRGAAAIAVRGARVVTPVVITVTPTTLTKAEPWYSIPARRFHFRLRVGEDIDPSRFTEQAPLPIASRRLNEHLHNHFIKELATDERSAA
ncbi:1-acyl-sn-glycerol-3-phosphate acyltransferase [Pseudomonas sp. ABC1]|uniref:lysophospholipid acyltransferase family protein n=1 Tax=Pseudomonas sp. ABC1 TaxID=2748080 RepID=UPI0015C3E4B6|nr:lysophospholipid acyltransferase family protein [Pseudomonas sp. ABC1]QLF95086.1 1-acyl-sn-glycerol-3-phosphate acyltransferase [Pseudomonas sp. ABC1]